MSDCLSLPKLVLYAFMLGFMRSCSDLCVYNWHLAAMN